MTIEHGMYAQLISGNGKKFVIQIAPDKTYSNVVVHVNFYSANNKRVGQKAYSFSGDKDKYIRKDQVTSKVFKFTFDDVSRVKIDFVNENEILDDKGESKGGTKINLPASDHALAPI
jgi:hypothetical protein